MKNLRNILPGLLLLIITLSSCEKYYIEDDVTATYRSNTIRNGYWIKAKTLNQDTIIFPIEVYYVQGDVVTVCEIGYTALPYSEDSVLIKISNPIQDKSNQFERHMLDVGLIKSMNASNILFYRIQNDPYHNTVLPKDSSNLNKLNLININK